MGHQNGRWGNTANSGIPMGQALCMLVPKEATLIQHVLLLQWEDYLTQLAR